MDRLKKVTIISMLIFCTEIRILGKNHQSSDVITLSNLGGQVVIGRVLNSSIMKSLLSNSIDL